MVTQDGVKFILGAMLEDEVAAINGVTEPAGALYGMANINITPCFGCWAKQTAAGPPLGQRR